MVNFAEHMAACILLLLLAGGCAARHLRAAEPSTAAPEPESIAVPGASGTGLQYPDHVRLLPFPTIASAPAPAPQGWYGKLTGQEAALVADLRSAINKDIGDLDQRISKQIDGLSQSYDIIMRNMYFLCAGVLFGYFFTLLIWFPMMATIFTFYHKVLLFIFPL